MLDDVGGDALGGQGIGDRLCAALTEAGLIPYVPEGAYYVLADASLLHYLNGGTETVAYMFGDYMRHFHAETAMGLLHFIDG